MENFNPLIPATQLHGGLLIYEPMEINDLWICAIALAHGMPVITQDDDFDVLADLSLVDVIRSNTAERPATRSRLTTTPTASHRNVLMRCSHARHLAWTPASARCAFTTAFMSLRKAGR